MMGMVITPRPCADCGKLGAGVQLVDDHGKCGEDFYCWNCAQKRSTPIPTDGILAAALSLVDPLWVRSREGAVWLAQALTRYQRRQARAADRADPK